MTEVNGSQLRMMIHNQDALIQTEPNIPKGNFHSHHDGTIITDEFWQFTHEHHWACARLMRRSTCQNCGRIAYGWHHQPVYCSAQCAREAYNRRRRERREAAHEKTCVFCGNKFHASRKDAKFCCGSHRVMAHLRKKGLK